MHLFIEDAEVLGHLEVVRNHEGQPDAIVRNAGLDALSGGGQPPMLNVARHELAGGGAQYVFSHQSRARHAQRHGILQLIAKAVCAARLIEARP
jgi:hypothetical protein